jgi:D-alanine-D-alanine ligase
MSMAPAQSSYWRVDDPAGFGKVAVLMGGTSAEREISLLSGQAVLAALLSRGVDAHAIDTADSMLTQLQSGHYSRVWIALHGRGGEDGTLQGLLTCMGLPFTGSGVLGCAITMDKLRTKRLLQGAGLATARFRVLREPADFAPAVEALGLPLMIKPAAEGSSLGLTRVSTPAELPLAYQNAARYHCEVFAEQWINGPEYTATLLHDEVLPLIRIDSGNTFYDYNAKYFSETTRYICPCGLDEIQETQFAAIAKSAFHAVGASGWGRVDFMLDDQERPLLLEINTVPGMTTHSLVPMAAAEAGLNFEELVWRILETSCVADRCAAPNAETIDAA